MISNKRPPELEIPEDNRLSLSQFFDKQAIGDLAGSYARVRGLELLDTVITHVRYQPRVSCLAGVEWLCRDMAGGETFAVRGYIKHLKDDAFELAQRRARKMPWTQGRLLDALVCCPESRCLVFEFPNDVRLTGLPGLHEPSRLASAMTQRFRHLASVAGDSDDLQVEAEQIMRYKPETRCIARVGVTAEGGRVGGVYAVRIERPSRALATMAALSHLPPVITGASAPDLAKPVMLDGDRGITAVPWVSGSPLSKFLGSDNARDVLVRTGAALARLHQTTISGTAARDQAHHLRRMNQTIEFLRAGYPGITKELRLLGKDLLALSSNTRPAPGGCVHGDFHQGQVMVTGDGVCFLDLDGVTRSETAMDLGNFTAQLYALRQKGRLATLTEDRDALLAGYDSTMGNSTDLRRLDYWTALGLLQLAAKQVRRLRSGWRERVNDYLSAAREVID